MTNYKCRAIALYLPQFHPIPENNEWWGPGFTEWTNVTKATPLFRGHIQPHLPADLGLYDLRVPEARIAQAELARAYGIEGFCYWHYWFAGRRLLERPFNEVLASGQPDFPFCLAWANETWTGIWHGALNRILTEQTYPGRADYEQHFRALLEAFQDPRYITVDGKPLFCVYRPGKLPEPREFTDCWRELAAKAGLKGIYLIGFAGPQWIPEENGFDASVADHTLLCTEIITDRLHRIANKALKRLTNKTLDQWRHSIKHQPRIYGYADYVKHVYDTEPLRPDRYPVVMANWDNTPRSSVRGVVLHNPTPELFRLHIREGLRRVEDLDDEHRIVIVKSWNEWAEGNYLEPDSRYGHEFLRVLRDEITSQ